MWRKTLPIAKTMGGMGVRYLRAKSSSLVRKRDGNSGTPHFYLYFELNSARIFGKGNR